MDKIKAPKYQEEINELLRMKKHLLGPQGCSCQSQQKNEWKAHCLSAGIYALAQLSRAEPENKPLTLEQVTERRGKPLWYQPITDGEETPFDNNPAWFICNPDKLPEPFYLYGKTWLAYAQEPVSE